MPSKPKPTRKPATSNRKKYPTAWRLWEQEKPEPGHEGGADLDFVYLACWECGCCFMHSGVATAYREEDGSVRYCWGKDVPYLVSDRIEVTHWVPIGLPSAGWEVGLESHKKAIASAARLRKG